MGEAALEAEVASLQRRLLDAENEADALAVAADRAITLEAEVAALKRELADAKDTIAELERRLESGAAGASAAVDEENDDAFLIPGEKPNFTVTLILERCHNGTNVLCARMHPAQDRLAASGGVDRAVRFWDASGGSGGGACSSVPGAVSLPAPVLSIDFRPTAGGALLAGCMDGSCHLVSWHTVGGLEPCADLSLFDDGAAGGDISRDEGGSSSGAKEPRILASFKDHSKYVVCSRWSADGGLFATASHDQTVSLYRFGAGGSGSDSGGRPFQKITTLHLPGAAECVEFVPSEGGATTLVVAHRTSAHLIYVDCETLQQTRVGLNANAWDEHVSFAVMGLQRSPTDPRYLLAACEKSRNILYCAGSNRHVRVLHTPPADIYHQPRCAWDASGKFAVGNSQPDNDLHVYCLASGREVGRAPGHSAAVRDISVHVASGRAMTASYDKSVRLWAPVPP